MKILHKSILCLILLALASGLSAAGDKATLTFFLGDVKIQRPDKSNIPARLNMLLETNDIIKTGKGSQAELSISGSVFYVDENKSVRVADLVPGTNTPVLVHALKKIKINTRMSKITTIAGVRANKQEEEITWATDPNSNGSGKVPPAGSDEDTLNRMATLIGSEQYGKACDLYSGSKVSEVLSSRMDFMGALAYFHMCRYPEASVLFCKLVKTSSDNQVKNESTFYAGLSLYTMASYKDAISYLTSYIEKQSNGIYAPQSYFLRGISYMNTGQSSRAKDDLKQLTTLYPSDPLAKDAEDILKKL